MQDFFHGLDSFTLRSLRRNGASPELIRCMRDALDRRLYYYGDHYNFQAVDSWLQAKWKIVRQYLGDCRKMARGATSSPGDTIDLVSSAYFNFNQELSSLGYTVCRPPWNIDQGRIFWHPKMVSEMRWLRHALVSLDFQELCATKFLSRVDVFINLISSLLIQHKVQAVVVPNDSIFFESVLVIAAKRAQVASYLFIHGYPGRYNSIDENLCDHLLVWGPGIGDNYRDHGIAQEKIHVVGSARYEGVKAIINAHNNGIPLVLCKAISGVPDSPGIRTGDRAFSLMYLDEVRETLLSLGVSRCRVRPHPSESLEWYRRHLGSDFFEWDNLPLNESLKKAAYVITPTSTVLFDAMASGCPFYAYEPLINGLGYDSAPLFPPFNGSEPDLPVAHTPKKLRENIIGLNHAKVELWPKYIAPFDAAKVAQVLGLKSPGNS